MQQDLFKNWPRFDGTEAWKSLTPSQKDQIGSLALELVLGWHGEDRYTCYTGPQERPEGRPFIAAVTMLTEELINSVDEALEDSVDALTMDSAVMPIPAAIGAVCRRCGCTQEDGCPEGCGWAEPDLCTSCRHEVPAPEPRA